MAQRLSEAERNRGAQVVALFSVLIHAWMTNNFEVAARTKRDLLVVGVEVEFRRADDAEVQHV